MSENIGLSPELEEALSAHWSEIVLDVGSKGYVSTNVERGTLLISVDPSLDPDNLDWGDNYLDRGGKVVALPTRVENIANALQGRVNRVQIIAPDPDEALSMLDSSFQTLRRGGKAVLVFDIASNKEEKVDGVIGAILEEYDRVRHEVYESGEVDTEELVEGSINSDLIFEDAKALVLTKPFLF